MSQSAVTGGLSNPVEIMNMGAPVSFGNWAGSVIDAGGLIRPTNPIGQFEDSITFQKADALNQIQGEKNALLGLQASLLSAKSLHSGVQVYENAQSVGPQAPPVKKDNTLLGFLVLGGIAYYFLKRRRR